ncbi:hypothetical protein GCK32_019115 [Trichostrongylus colubriformis]|uniref:Apple domain-containing protein n=1 Tax=Trichostrongylus colubriformis TaxID=6319 RepID=A0AAN8FPB6_TRICO
MVKVNNELFMPFLVAVILSEVTPANTCTFYNYPNNTAMVKRIGDFFGTQDIHGCMWHCYNTANCVMIRYRHANKNVGLGTFIHSALGGCGTCVAHDDDPVEAITPPFSENGCGPGGIVT